jgi:hypothetical protein
VFDLGDKGEKESRRRLLLKLPYKAGDTWKETYTTKYGKEWNVVCKAGDMESVKTPAGTFKTIPVESKYTSGDTEVTTKSWYAQEIGLIKETYADQVTELLLEYSDVLPF